MTVALWTIYRYSPGYEIHDDEAEAAAAAVTMQEYELGEHGVVMGVQYDDGRALSREDWPAYWAEYERRRAEDAARIAAAASQPRKPAPPQRVIEDPFRGYAMDIDASEPAWLGKPGRDWLAAPVQPARLSADLTLDDGSVVQITEDVCTAGPASAGEITVKVPCASVPAGRRISRVVIRSGALGGVEFAADVVPPGLPPSGSLDLRVSISGV